MDDDTQDQNRSADNALEPKDDIFNPKRDEPKLPGDYNTPAAPPNDVAGRPIPQDDPSTDAHLDETEVYNEGVANAAQDNRSEETSDTNDQPRKIA